MCMVHYMYTTLQVFSIIVAYISLKIREFFFNVFLLPVILNTTTFPSTTAKATTAYTTAPPHPTTHPTHLSLTYNQSTLYNNICLCTCL